MRVSTKTGFMIFIGVLVGFALIYVMGVISDKNGTVVKDSFTPLYYIVPIMAGILALLISRYRK